MRHNISGRKLNRKTSHRLALLRNLSKSLIVHEQIETTLPKAKDLRPFIEKILTIGKTNSLAAKRKVFSYLGDQNIVDKVFNVLAKRYQKRNGGYSRILKSGYRYGDSAPKAVIELVERDINAKGLEDKLRHKKDNQESDQQIEKSVAPGKISKSEIEKNTNDKKEKHTENSSVENKK
jgi:large subunit ribosomal protein L17